MQRYSAILAVLFSVLFISFKAEAALQVRGKGGKTAVIAQIGDPICNVRECYPVSRGNRYEDIKRAAGGELTVEQIVLDCLPDNDPQIPTELRGTCPNLASAFTVVGDGAKVKRYNNARLGIATLEDVRGYAKRGYNLRFGLRSRIPDLVVVLPKRPDPCLARPETCRAAVANAVALANTVTSCKAGQLFDPHASVCVDPRPVASLGAVAPRSAKTVPPDKTGADSAAGVTWTTEQRLLAVAAVLILGLCTAVLLLMFRLREVTRKRDQASGELEELDKQTVSAGLQVILDLFKKIPHNGTVVERLPPPALALYGELRRLRDELNVGPLETLFDAVRRLTTVDVNPPLNSQERLELERLRMEAAQRGAAVEQTLKGAVPPPPPPAAEARSTLSGISVRTLPAGSPSRLSPMGAVDLSGARMAVDAAKRDIVELEEMVDGGLELAGVEQEPEDESEAGPAPKPLTARLTRKIRTLLRVMHDMRNNLSAKRKSAADQPQFDEGVYLRAPEAPPDLADGAPDDAGAPEGQQDSILMVMENLRKVQAQVGELDSHEARIARLEVKEAAYRRALQGLDEIFQANLPPLEVFVKAPLMVNQAAAKAALENLRVVAESVRGGLPAPAN